MAVKPMRSETAVLVPAKKKPVKEKRKRKKSLEKNNKDTTVMASKMYCRQDKGSKRRIQELHMQLKLSCEEIYDIMHFYLTCPEVLQQKGFPLENPEKPGQIILSSSRKVPNNNNPTSKICSRCFREFFIVNDEYTSVDDYCIYHPLRLHYSGVYSCCEGFVGSVGCRRNRWHVYSEVDLEGAEFKNITKKKHPRVQSCNVYALDCEMVYTTIGMEVAKVGVVDIFGNAIYQSYVQPSHRILDYNTEFSGIRKQDLERVVITLSDAQSVLLRILNKDTILVGHALQNDLRVLRLIHEKVVDTQVVFHEGTHLKKLKTLSEQVLKKTIQSNKEGHDSIEDAQACMELILWKIKEDMAKSQTSFQREVFKSNNYGSETSIRKKETIQSNKEGHDSIEDVQACKEFILWKIKNDMAKSQTSFQREVFKSINYGCKTSLDQDIFGYVDEVPSNCSDFIYTLQDLKPIEYVFLKFLRPNFRARADSKRRLLWGDTIIDPDLFFEYFFKG